jgi:hypothetical protein
MRSPRPAFLLFIASGAMAFSPVCAAEKPAEIHAKRFVIPGADGRLVYERDARGNRIPDFSHAGYGGGGVALPEAKTVATVAPGDGDDGARIQTALDAAAPAEGHAAVELAEGTYEIAGSLVIRRSGVVLRGKGAVILMATGTGRRALIQFQGRGEPKLEGTEREVVGWREPGDRFVPTGATELTLDSVDGLARGDSIRIRRPSPEEWIKAVGMWQLPGNPGPSWLSWKPGKVDVVWERRVANIYMRRVILDAPLTCALGDESGTALVEKFTWPQRLQQCGVENVTCVSEFDAANPHDEEHSWIAVQFDKAEDCWVRGVTARHFVSSTVYVSGACRRITVENCASASPVSEVAGQRRHSFYTAGGQTLFVNCRAENGRHDFSTGWMAPGPNVFLDCTAQNALDFAGPIESWATGVLCDNVIMDGGGLRLDNHETRDQGAGWCAANCVLWQCQASEIIARMPPGAQNWVIGTWGQYAGDAHWRALNEFVEPRSLYRAQLAEREAVNEASGPYPPPPRESPPPHASHSLALKNGWLTVDGAVLAGAQRSLTWWRGHPSLPRAAEFGQSITRWVPGVSPLNDDLAALAANMASSGQAAVRHYWGLWYDRRRDDHQMIRRANAGVWPPFYEQPWARSGTGRAWDGLSKYDLTKFNPWYFGRLREFADHAEKNGVVLVNAMYFQHNILEAGAHWADFPWRSANCIQDTGFPEPPEYVGGKRIFMAEAFYDITNPVRRDLHSRYIRQCLENLADEPNVIHVIGEEYTGPLHFMQFWLDTAAEWRRETGKHPLLALSAPKDVQDAILHDPQRAAEIGAIDFKYWWLSPKGLYAPSGGQNLAPRQSEREWKGGPPTDATLAAMCAEYRTKIPDKAILCDFPQAGWAFLCAGGSLANLPKSTDRALLAAAAKMKPHAIPAGHALRGDGPQFLIRLPAGAKPELDLSGEQGTLELLLINQETGSPQPQREHIPCGGKAKLPQPDGKSGSVYWLRPQ